MFNPNQKILNLRGEEIPKSFPTQKEIDKLPKDKLNQPDLNKLEKETIGNIILNCLANYIVKDKKEGFYINLIAQSILSIGVEIEKEEDREGNIVGTKIRKVSNKKIEFKEKIKKFLVELLDEQTLRREKTKVKNEKGVEEEKEEVKGLYQAWVIALIKNEFLSKDEIENDKA